MKNWKLLLLTSLFIAPLANAEEAKKPTKPQWEVIDTLTDAKGDVYELRKKHEVKHNLQKTLYDFGLKGEVNSVRKTVFNSVVYGVGIGCPFQEKKEPMDVRLTVFNEGYYKKYLNEDNILDLGFSAVIKNCQTGEFVFKDILLLSKSDKSFEYQSFENNNANPQGYPQTLPYGARKETN